MAFQQIANSNRPEQSWWRPKQPTIFGFDNGIKRWPERNSMHLNIELNQLFSKNGEIEIFNKDCDEYFK